MKILHTLTFLSLSLLLAMPAAFASGQAAAAASPAAGTGTRGGTKTPRTETQGWFSGFFGGNAKPGSSEAADSAATTNYFWPVVGTALTTGSFAAYKYIPVIRQKVDAGVKFGKDKFQTLQKKLNAASVALDKPLSQRDVLVTVVGGLAVYHLGTPTINKISEIKKDAGTRLSTAYTSISESDFVKNYITKNNYTKAATVVALVATPIVVYKAYQALQARKAVQKIAPKPVAKPVVQIAQA